MSKWITSRFRLTIGLCAILLSVFFAAVMLKMVPADEGVRASRTKLSESLAITTTVMISRNDLGSLRSVVDSIVKRNADLRSVGVRRGDGRLLCSSEKHSAMWKPMEVDENATEEQMRLGLYKRNEKWGQLELCYYPFFGNNMSVSTFRHPWIRLALFMGSCCFILFAIYLGKMLTQLDPTKTVPKRVQSAYNLSLIHI